MATDQLSAARMRLAEKKAAGEKLVRLDPVEKAKRNPGSLRLAVNAACWQCNGSGLDGEKETRDRIQKCTVILCALHPHRPYQSGEPEAA